MEYNNIASIKERNFVMTTFNSNAEEIRYYTKQLLDSGNEKSTQEIISYVKSTTGKDFTQGMFSGAINDLINMERSYKRIRRGIYQKALPVENNGDEFDLIIKNTIEEIENALKMDIRNLTPEILKEKQEKSKKIISSLQNLLS